MYTCGAVTNYTLLCYIHETIPIKDAYQFLFDDDLIVSEENSVKFWKTPRTISVLIFRRNSNVQRLGVVDQNYASLKYAFSIYLASTHTIFFS